MITHELTNINQNWNEIDRIVDNTHWRYNCPPRKANGSETYDDIQELFLSRSVRWRKMNSGLLLYYLINLDDTVVVAVVIQMLSENDS